MLLQIDLDEVIKSLEDQHKQVKKQMRREGIKENPASKCFDDGFGAAMDSLKVLSASFTRQALAAKNAGSN